MKNLKILQTPIRFAPAIGGVENHVLYLSKQLVKKQHKVEVICANEPISNINKLANISVKRLNYRFKVTNTNICLSLPYHILKSSFDLVHTHMPTPWTSDWSILLAKIMNKKSIITIHNDMDKPGFISKTITKVYVNTVFRISLLLVDKIIIVNPTWKKSFTATKKILEKYHSKIVVIPNGIDINLFSRKDNLKRKKNEVLFISILDVHHKFKGLHHLLEAIAIIKNKYPKIHLKIIGEGELKKYYQSMAKDLDIKEHVTFLGEVKQKDLPLYYSQASMFVLPSTEIEGFGIVLLEAMACGTPVIATDIVGTSADIKKYNTGIIVKPSKSNLIAKAIDTLLSNQKLANVMGSNGRKLIAEKYDWKLVADQVSYLYKETLS